MKRGAPVRRSPDTSYRLPENGVGPTALAFERFGVVAAGDGSDCGGGVGAEVPGFAASCDDVPAGLEDGDGEEAGAEGPDPVQLRGTGRAWQEGDVAGQAKGLRAMPAGIVRHGNGRRSRSDGPGDLCEGGVHRRGAGAGHDLRGGHRRSGTDRIEEPGPGAAGLAEHARAGAAPGPDAGEGALRAKAIA